MWKKITEQWKNFIPILLSPYFLLFSGLTILSILFSILKREDILFSNLLTIIAGVSGGIAGTFFEKEYTKKFEGSILEKKGLSAIRNLQAINIQISNIEKWIAGFIKDVKKKEDKKALEEINRHMLSLKINIISGVQDWADMVPGLRELIQENVAIDKKYKKVIQKYISELLEKREELSSADNKEKINSIKGRISDLEKQIKKTKKERLDIISTSGTPVSGFVDNNLFPRNDGFVGRYSSVLSVGSNQNRCFNCGELFESENLGIVSTLNMLCPKCRS